MNHSEAQKRLWANPDYNQRQGSAISRVLRSSRRRKRASEAQLKVAAANRIRMNRRWANPDYQKRMTENTRQSWKDPEIAKRRREGMKRSWVDPKLKKKRVSAIRRGLNRSEARERSSAASKRNWADPAAHERHRQAIKRGFAKPGVRERQSAAIKQGLAQRSVRKRMSLSGRRRVENDPGFVERLRAARELRNEERRAILAVAESTAEQARILNQLSNKPLAWRRIVPLLLISRNLSNSEVQNFAGINLSRSAMNRLRNFCGVPGPQGRRAKLTQKRRKRATPTQPELPSR